MNRMKKEEKRGKHIPEREWEEGEWEELMNRSGTGVDSEAYNDYLEEEKKKKEEKEST